MPGLRDELQAIYDRVGSLTPAVVVDEARPKNHPLHSRFEWDNAVAGHRYRLIQAHELIQSVKVSYTDRKGAHVDVRAFHAVKNESGYEYKPVDEVTSDPVLTEIVRRDMEREWRQLKARYDRFKEFSEMVLQDLNPAA